MRLTDAQTLETRMANPSTNPGTAAAKRNATRSDRAFIDADVTPEQIYLFDTPSGSAAL